MELFWLKSKVLCIPQLFFFLSPQWYQLIAVYPLIANSLIITLNIMFLECELIGLNESREWSPMMKSVSLLIMGRNRNVLSARRGLREGGQTRQPWRESSPQTPILQCGDSLIH